MILGSNLGAGEDTFSNWRRWSSSQWTDKWYCFPNLVRVQSGGNFFNFSHDAAEKYFDFWWRKYTKGTYFDVYTFFRILDPSILVCIMARSTVLKSRNYPYYACIWVTPSPSQCGYHLSMAPKTIVRWLQDIWDNCRTMTRVHYILLQKITTRW